MLSLRELQKEFIQGLFAGESVRLADYIGASELTSQQRLAIYRNNSFSNFQAALSDVFPVVQRLVGEPFFEQMANCFIRDYPSLSGDIHEFGAQFPTFLTLFEPVKSLSYLPDVAQLEWVLHQIFHAAECPGLAVDQLAAIPKERYGELAFKLHPTIRLMTSAFPIHQIWQVNQPGYVGDERVDLSAGEVNLLLFRRHFATHFQPLAAAEFAFLTKLAQAMPFTQICEQVLAAYPAFDLSAVFQGWVAEGFIVSFE